MLRTFGHSLIAIALAGCAQATPSLSLDGRMTSPAAKPPDSSGYQQLYSFAAPPDGNSPVSDLMLVGNLMYGTTYGGGKSSLGTVYSINPSSPPGEKVVYSFRGAPDGAVPEAGITPYNGVLYGTTFFGGRRGKGCFTDRGCGTVYSIANTESVLYKFGGAPGDGANPVTGVHMIGGTFYGTTRYGGRENFGVLYSLTPSGAEKVLHNFTGGPNDGAYPVGNLVPLPAKCATTSTTNCSVYGVTAAGGKSNVGTLFEFTITGTSIAYKGVVHPFTASEGDSPVGLTSNGTTLYGAASSDGQNNRGALFQYDTQKSSPQAFSVIHAFKGFDGDGAVPLARPIYSRGVLYGTTREAGNGTIYKMVLSNSKECQIYRFGAIPDGQRPVSPLAVDSNSTPPSLFGTTIEGGRYANKTTNDGYGTVFVISPSAPCVKATPTPPP